MFRRGVSLAEHPLQAVSGEFVPHLGDKFRFGSKKGSYSFPCSRSA